MSPDAPIILAAMDRRRGKLARWIAAHSEGKRAWFKEQEAAAYRGAEASPTLDEWYRDYRRPSEAEQIRLHGRVVGPVGSGIEQVGILPGEDGSMVTLVADADTSTPSLRSALSRRHVTLTIPICA